MLYLIFILFETLDCAKREHGLIEIQDKESPSHNIGITNVKLVTDFNYNEISLVNKKMPFINCNRKIFLNPKIDIVDMFVHGNANFANECIMNIDKTLLRLTSILNITSSLLKTNHHLKNNIIHLEQYFIGFGIVCGNSRILKSISKRLSLLLNIHNEHIIIDIKEIRSVFEFIDKYLYETDICPYILEVKPSEILRALIDDKHQILKDTRMILSMLLAVYDNTFEFLIWFKRVISNFNNPNYIIDRHIPYILSIDILAKWKIYVQKTNIIANIKFGKVVEPCYHIIVYSINTYYLAEEITKIIKLLLIEKTENELIKHKIKKSLIQKNIFLVSKFESYDVIIMNKTYTIKKYNLNEASDIPSGISTAYLNVNSMFESIGYMGFTKATHDYYFLSVEERPEIYFGTDDLEYFETKEDQILYFILDFLHILDQLKLYRIKLLSYGILFAVVKSPVRWKYRVDDVGQFCYVNESNLYESPQ